MNPDPGETTKPPNVTKITARNDNEKIIRDVHHDVMRRVELSVYNFGALVGKGKIFR
jgi:hypothetical protein